MRMKALVLAALAAVTLSTAAEEKVLGYHLDISNCKVPRLETMYRIVDILQRLGYNHLPMNTDPSFA